ncbi:TRAP transporter small permease [Shouchella shacheensis]|uniref:TRAP transporter small permease n=1 Tax=Shouchella shacheensis TaxID=1649580 RepID=UPI0007405719|nr:TRAP transporter small permease [Shouchella shacheensis]
MLKKLYDNFEEIAGGVLFIGMFLVLVAQTSARQGFSAPLVWSEELSKLIFIYVAYFGVISCIKDNSHVSIDIFVKKLPEKAQKWVYIFNQLLILAALVLIFIISIPIVERQATLNIITLQISYMYMYIALPVLTLFMIFRLVERIVNEWRRGKTREVE